MLYFCGHTRVHIPQPAGDLKVQTIFISKAWVVGGVGLAFSFVVVHFATLPPGGYEEDSSI